MDNGGQLRGRTGVMLKNNVGESYGKKLKDIFLGNHLNLTLFIKFSKFRIFDAASSEFGS